MFALWRYPEFTPDDQVSHKTTRVAIMGAKIVGVVQTASPKQNYSLV